MRKDRAWMTQAGWAAIGRGGLAFGASATSGGGGSLGGALIAGALNPLFFVGVPLGLYWLGKAKGPITPRAEQSAGTNPAPPPVPPDRFGNPPAVHAERVPEPKPEPKAWPKIPAELEPPRESMQISLTASLATLTLLVGLGLGLVVGRLANVNKLEQVAEMPVRTASPPKSPAPVTAVAPQTTVVRSSSKTFDIDHIKPKAAPEVETRVAVNPSTPSPQPQTVPKSFVVPEWNNMPNSVRGTVEMVTWENGELYCAARFYRKMNSLEGERAYVFRRSLAAKQQPYFVGEMTALHCEGAMVAGVCVGFQPFEGDVVAIVLCSLGH